LSETRLLVRESLGLDAILLIIVVLLPDADFVVWHLADLQHGIVAFLTRT
jgi:hypothetical protein